MRITRKNLRRLIERVASIKQAHDEYGEVLFGDERGLDEPNTKKEIARVNKLRDWFAGNLASLKKPEVEIYQDFRKLGLYSDVLDPPSYAKNAYRFTTLSMGKIKTMIRKKIDQITAESGDQIDVYEIKPARLDTLGRKGRSWTNDANAFSEILEDWGFLYSGWGDPKNADDALVFFIADLQQNKDSFLFNPDELEDISAYYAYQKEEIQISPVKLSGGFVYKPVGFIKDKEDWDYAALNDFLRRTGHV